MRQPRANRNRVLIPIYYYYPYVSGVSVFAKIAAEGLVKLGYDVTVLTSQFDKDLPRHEIIEGVTIVRQPVLFKLNKGVIMPTFWLNIVKYARQNDYVNLNLPMAESGLAALFIPKRKLMTSYHCDLFLGNGLLDKLITFISFSLMHIALARSRVITPSSYDYFDHSKMRRYRDKVRTVTPPIPSGEFKPVDSIALYTQLGIKKDEVKIGFVGRIVYEKGINYLLEAIPYLAKEFPRFKIIVAGDYKKVAGGSIKEELDHYLETYPDNILFTGYLEEKDINSFYSGLDVFVLPSIDPLEAFGMVQVEAMLCGVPVVASNLPGVRQIVKKTGYGKISEIKQPKDIAKQIIEVVTHRERYQPERSKVIALYDAQIAINTYAELMPKGAADR